MSVGKSIFRTGCNSICYARVFGAVYEIKEAHAPHPYNQPLQEHFKTFHGLSAALDEILVGRPDVIHMA